LNHEDYSFDDALPALESIRNKGIPLILTTSKTRRETEHLQKELGLDDPFIVENGAAIYFPPKYTEFFLEGFRQESSFRIMQIIQLGISYDRIRSFIDEIRDQFKIRGFGDMSVHEVSEITGLSPGQSEFARAREYTEPFIMENEQDIHLLQGLAVERGIKITKGGRFHHMIGIYQDKGEAVKIVRDIFDRKKGKKHLVVAIGDGINDIPMLKNADIPVLMPHPLKGRFIDISLPGLVMAREFGSKGWNEVIGRLLDELETGNT
ncbi:MAG: HAD-IIB family hydrolase, partial [Deltaproteobacteria bacterium]|nr:HAD-IIB family hydrolase [Deltaproteobacteria bacterium]